MLNWMASYRLFHRIFTNQPMKSSIQVGVCLDSDLVSSDFGCVHTNETVKMWLKCRLPLAVASCKGIFLHQGKNSDVIHQHCFPFHLSSSISELTTVFSHFKNGPNLATQKVFTLLQPGDGSLDFIWSVNSRFQMKRPHLQWTLDHFICLHVNDLMRE